MRKIIEGLLSILFLIGIGYILYDSIFAKKNKHSLLKKEGLETRGIIDKVRGDDLQVWLTYMFRVEGKIYYGECDADIRENKGDSINVVYLRENPEVNAKKEELDD